VICGTPVAAKNPGPAGGVAPLSATDTRLRSRLDTLYSRYGSSYLDSDPIRFPRRFARPEDREVTGFVAAVLAYGRVAQIQRSLDRVAAVMGPGPAEFVRRAEPSRVMEQLAGFTHRFNDARDVALLFWFLRQMLERSGTMQGFFLEGYSTLHDDTGPALASFTDRALALDTSPWYAGGALPPDAGVRFFFPSPAGGSSCKRLNLFLRWMVRPDDGVDFGLWRGVEPARLVIPLDTHVSRICTYIGLTQRRTVGWKMAIEVTRRLRMLDPSDPIKYDFALSRLGILEACPRRRDAVKCRACDLRQVCTLS